MRICCSFPDISQVGRHFEEVKLKVAFLIQKIVENIFCCFRSAPQAAPAPIPADNVFPYSVGPCYLIDSLISRVFGA